jgi:PBP1b-binding outer membrane lipoprotein LpoB
MKRVIACAASILVLAGCTHHTPPPSPNTSRTITATTTATTPTAPSTTTARPTYTHTPFENPPDSTGLGKG